MRFRRRRDGDSVEVRLDGAEREVLAGLPDQLRELLALDAGEVRDRLFPRAYLDPTEDEAEREWQRLMHDELLASKIAALDVVAETLERAETAGSGARAPELHHALHGGPGAAARVEHVVDEHHHATRDVDGDLGRPLGHGCPHAVVVPVERDVEGADRHGDRLEAGEGVSDTAGEGHASRVQPHEHHVRRAVVPLGDLVRDARQRPLEVGGVEDRRPAYETAPPGSRHLVPRVVVGRMPGRVRGRHSLGSCRP